MVFNKMYCVHYLYMYKSNEHNNNMYKGASYSNSIA